MATNERGTSSASHWGTSSHRRVNLFLWSRIQRRKIVLTALLSTICYIVLARLLLVSNNDHGHGGADGGVYDLRNSDQDRHDLPEKGTGQGILLFAYGTEYITTERYIEEAFVSARRIKAFNPTANITLVTNPDLHPTIDGVFDLVINIEPKYMIAGEVSSWTPNGFPRQWLTRIEYLGRSPYEITFALDAGVLCCSSRVDEVLKQGLQEFDIAFAVQGPRVLAPHNWAIMYRLNDNMRRLLKRWRILQIAMGATGSDQGTLHAAAGSLALQGKLNVGVISEVVALSLVPYNRTAPTWPKTSQLVPPGPVLFFHYKAFSHEEEVIACKTLNEDTSRARVLFQYGHMPRDPDTKILQSNKWEMMYSEVELAEAAKSVNPEGFYFKGLDWNNSDLKWCHTVTPWLNLYPQCWDNLYEEVDEKIISVMGSRKIRSSPGFAAEFADDLFWQV